MGSDEAPYRVVDSHDQGWLTTGPTAEAGHLYEASYGWKRGLERMTLDQLAAERGGWRPVVAPTDDEDAAIEAAIRAAGRKAIASIAAALDVVFHEVREQHDGLSDPHGSYVAAKMALMAGREGSWESEVLIQVVMAGNGFNLVRPKGRGHADASQMRAAGPSPRVDRAARDDLAAVFTAWTRSTDRYVEVAETLASIVSRFADDEYGPDGWRRIADQWLQPDAPVRSEDFSACYRLLYSQSEHFDPDVL
jgi:hypothetical protein